MDETKKLDELEAFEAEIASLEGKDGRWTGSDGLDSSSDAAPPPSSVVVSLSKRPVLDKQPAGPLPKSVKPKKPKLTKSGKAAKIKALASSISSSLSRSTTLKKAKIVASSGSSSSTNSHTTSSTTTSSTPIISANPIINPQSYLVPTPSTNSFNSPHPTNSYTTPHQTSTPASSSTTTSTTSKVKKPLQKNLRAAAGRIWEDKTLDDWPENDFRIFCGDLGNEVNDNTLAKAFVRYGSFAKAKVIRDKRTQKTKGFGFVSFLDPFDCARALKEMNGKYIGNRPVKLRKSVWDRRAFAPTKRKRKKGKKKDAEDNPEEGSPDPEAAE